MFILLHKIVNIVIVTAQKTAIYYVQELYTLSGLMEEEKKLMHKFTENWNEKYFIHLTLKKYHNKRKHQTTVPFLLMYL